MNVDVSFSGPLPCPTYTDLIDELFASTRAYSSFKPKLSSDVVPTPPPPPPPPPVVSDETESESEDKELNQKLEDRENQNQNIPKQTSKSEQIESSPISDVSPTRLSRRGRLPKPRPGADIYIFDEPRKVKKPKAPDTPNNNNVQSSQDNISDKMNTIRNNNENVHNTSATKSPPTLFQFSKKSQFDSKQIVSTGETSDHSKIHKTKREKEKETKNEKKQKNKNKETKPDKKKIEKSSEKKHKKHKHKDEKRKEKKKKKRLSKTSSETETEPLATVKPTQEEKRDSPLPSSTKDKTQMTERTQSTESESKSQLPSQTVASTSTNPVISSPSTTTTQPSTMSTSQQTIAPSVNDKKEADNDPLKLKSLRGNWEDFNGVDFSGNKNQQQSDKSENNTITNNTIVNNAVVNTQSQSQPQSQLSSTEPTASNLPPGVTPPAPVMKKKRGRKPKSERLQNSTSSIITNLSDKGDSDYIFFDDDDDDNLFEDEDEISGNSNDNLYSPRSSHRTTTTTTASVQSNYSLRTSSGHRPRGRPRGSKNQKSRKNTLDYILAVDYNYDNEIAALKAQTNMIERLVIQSLSSFETMLANVKHIINTRLNQLERKLFGLSTSESIPEANPSKSAPNDLMIEDLNTTENSDEGQMRDHSHTDHNKNNVHNEEQSTSYPKDEFGMANINGNEELFSNTTGNSMILDPNLYHAVKRPDSPEQSILPILDAHPTHNALGTTVDSEINTAYSEHYASSYEYNNRTTATGFVTAYQSNENNTHFIDQSLYFEQSAQSTPAVSTSLLKHQPSANQNSSSTDILFHDFSNSQLSL